MRKSSVSKIFKFIVSVFYLNTLMKSNFMKIKK